MFNNIYSGTSKFESLGTREITKYLKEINAGKRKLQNK